MPLALRRFRLRLTRLSARRTHWRDWRQRFVATSDALAVGIAIGRCRAKEQGTEESRRVTLLARLQDAITTIRRVIVGTVCPGALALVNEVIFRLANLKLTAPDITVEGFACQGDPDPGAGWNRDGSWHSLAGGQIVAIITRLPLTIIVPVTVSVVVHQNVDIERTRPLLIVNNRVTLHIVPKIGSAQPGLFRIEMARSVVLDKRGVKGVAFVVLLDIAIRRVAKIHLSDRRQAKQQDKDQYESPRHSTTTLDPLRHAPPSL